MLPGAVLRHYPPEWAGGAAEPLGNAGGFSGARLWRVTAPAGLFCLRAAPASAVELMARHGWMRVARQAGLTFVPAVLPTRDGASFVERDDVLWELQQWMPGVADFHKSPTEPRLKAACTALAQLHAVWRRLGAQTGPAPAVARRVRALEKDPSLLARSLLRELMLWLEVPLTLQPCLCDVWHDHVFYEGDTVSGIVDYAAMRLDVPEVDLARLLGSLIEDDEPRWATALNAYERVLPIHRGELIRLLDRAGTLVALRRWQARGTLNEAGRRRMDALRRRVEWW